MNKKTFKPTLSTRLCYTIPGILTFLFGIFPFPVIFACDSCEDWEPGALLVYLFFAFIGLYLILLANMQRLVTSAHGITFKKPFTTIHSSWGNVERITVEVHGVNLDVNRGGANITPHFVSVLDHLTDWEQKPIRIPLYHFMEKKRGVGWYNDELTYDLIQNLPHLFRFEPPDVTEIP